MQPQLVHRSYPIIDPARAGQEAEMRICGVFGAGGFGREVLPLLRDMCVPHSHSRAFIYVDDFARSYRINGVGVSTFKDFCAVEAAHKELVIAIANSRVRAEIAVRCAAHGIGFAQVRAPNALIMDNVDMREGAIICPFVTITSDVRIGRHFHANVYSYVAHDCVIGDYVTFAPRVTCNGNVLIEDHAYIGAGAILKQGSPGKPLVIGKGAVVGMGAVVTKDVAAGETVVGNPAHPLVRER